MKKDINESPEFVLTEIWLIVLSEGHFLYSLLSFNFYIVTKQKTKLRLSLSRGPQGFCGK
jgi:hypothetical protein